MMTQSATYDAYLSSQMLEKSVSCWLSGAEEPGHKKPALTQALMSWSSMPVRIRVITSVLSAAIGKDRLHRPHPSEIGQWHIGFEELSSASLDG